MRERVFIQTFNIFLVIWWYFVLPLHAFAGSNFLKQLMTSCTKSDAESWVQSHKPQYDMVVKLVSDINRQVKPAVPVKDSILMQPKIAKVRDVALESFVSIFGYFKERVRYQSLDRDMRQVNTRLLYGTSFVNIEEAYDQVALFFRIGRIQKNWDSDNLVEYAARMDYANQSYPFLGTSHLVSQALVYGRKPKSIEKPKFGVVYVIDPTNAPVLDLTKFARSRGLNPETDDLITFWNEHEVVFSSQIPPHRFVAAFILENDVRVESFVYRQEVRYVLLNPNYRPESL